MRIIWPAATALLAVAIYAVVSLGAPRLLMFPHHAVIGRTPVYASRPISPDIHRIVAAADARVRTSDLFAPDVLRRPVFLTDGGPRWRLLSLGAGGSFGLTRPVSGAIIVNQSRIGTNRVFNGASVGGERSLSGVIAHERTHMMIRERFGLFADRVLPTWKVEGYCDHVAGEGSLSDMEAARLRAMIPPPPALFYYDARKRVEAILLRNGGSAVDLFSRDPSP